MFRKNNTPMNILITSRHESLSDGLKEHIEGKIRRVERYLGAIKEAHIILTFEKNIHVCEVNLHSTDLQTSAKATSRDMYQSIDAALTRLEKQAKKHKEKKEDRYRPKGEKAQAVVHGLIPNPTEGEAHKVIKSKKYAVKPMSVEEAAMQLSTSKDEFLVFLDSEMDKTCVVYKRKDNHIGLIEPEF